MWRRLLYVVCTVEAAVLAAVLVGVVIDRGATGSALSPRMRQLCAIVALVLMIGCSYAVVCWLRDAVTAGRARLNARSGVRAGRSQLQGDLGSRSVPEARAA